MVRLGRRGGRLAHVRRRGARRARPTPASTTRALPQAHGTQLCFADTNHGWDGTHQEIDNGKMDGFAIANDGTHEDPMFGPPDFLSGARAMTYYTKADLPFMYWAADNFAIGDRYFASVPGPTWPNREYLYAGTSWGETTTGEFPKPTSPTVLDSLDAKGIVWGNYAGALSTVLLFSASSNYTSHYAKKLYPSTQLATDAMNGKLPPVTFLDPNLYPEGYDNDDEHPPAVMQVGENWLAGTMKTLMASPQWAHMARVPALRRARRALRPRASAAGVPAGRDAAEARDAGRWHVRGVRRVRHPAALRRAVSLRQAPLREPPGVRSHVGAALRRGPLRAARAHQARRERARALGRVRLQAPRRC